MRKLFLASLFNGVSGLLSSFVEGDLAGKSVTFIPTASIPETVNFFVGSGRKALLKLGLNVDELEVSTASEDEIVSKLQSNDLIYVTGGNTFFLLQELKKAKADKILVEQINLGKLYIGESAGAIIVAPDIEYAKGLDDFKKAPELEAFSSLGVVDFYPLPHHTNSPFKKAVEKIIANYEAELKLCPISNTQVILVDNEDVRIESKKTKLSA